MTNGRFAVALLSFALAASLAGLGGAIKSYAQQQVLDQRVTKLERLEDDHDEVHETVTVLTTEFKGFKEQYAKDQQDTKDALQNILEEVRSE